MRVLGLVSTIGSQKTREEIVQMFSFIFFMQFLASKRNLLKIKGKKVKISHLSEIMKFISVIVWLVRKYL